MEEGMEARERNERNAVMWNAISAVRFPKEENKLLIQDTL